MKYIINKINTIKNKNRIRKKKLKNWINNNNK